MSAESLAKARVEVIEGEAVEEVMGRARGGELMIRMALWSYTTYTDSAQAPGGVGDRPPHSGS
jgi:hypothetical protein